MTTKIKILVAIANYGTTQDQYLEKLLASYRSMPFQVHIVVLSNLWKDFGADVEVKVGLPAKDPWSLPFAHKQIFADRISDYDLFIYSEDDMLVSETNIRAFLDACRVLNDDEIPGFLRTEQDTNGNEYFCDAFDHWHWDPFSVVTRGGHTFAAFSNEHAACYALTREQLRRCIGTGGFLLAPHEGRHDLLCAAATDPYTRCGLRKLICVSDLDNFLLPHLSNKYVTKFSLPGADFRRQVKALLQIQEGRRSAAQLFETETLLPGIRWSKSYYEPARPDELNLIPADSRRVLFVGSGCGLAEEALRKRGIRVVALPLDSVISSCAEARGIEVIHGCFGEAQDKLRENQFDCVFLSNILHVFPEPTRLLKSLTKNVAPGGRIVTTVPNLMKPRVVWGRFLRDKRYATLGEYAKSRVHVTSGRQVRGWLIGAGYKIDRTVPVLSKTIPKWISAIPLLSIKGVFASEFIIVATKR